MFDPSRKALFGAGEGGQGEDSLPRFQPLPGGFGKRQTPVAAGGAPASTSTPGGARVVARPADRRDSDARDAARDNRDANPGGAQSRSVTGRGDAAQGASREKPGDRPSGDNPSGDNPLGLVAVGGGLATFGGEKPVAPEGRLGHVPTRLEHWLSKEFRHVRDVPCETTLTVIGAITGFAAQHGIWEAVVKPGKMAIQEAFVVIETRSGETFFFGDHLNDILAAPDPAQLSVWKIVAGAARAMGAAELPDITSIFKHCAETVGTTSFGLPRLPDGHLPTILPRDAVNRFWPEARSILASRSEAGTDPLAWAIDAATAAQQLMLGMKDRIDPVLAAQVVMEAAIPMSRIDPMTVPKA